MRVGSIFALVVALALGGTAAFLARTYLVGQSAPKAAIERKMVVATQPLAFGVALTPENTKEVPWPAGSSLEGSFSSQEALLKDGRRAVLAAIQANEPIFASKITGPGQRATLSTLIEDGMRAVAIRVDDVRGVAGFILPGDRVDVVLTRGDSTRDDNGFADILLQNVKVLAIDQFADEKQEKVTVVKAVTLELNSEQAQKVILAQGVGRLSLILNKAGNAVITQTNRITVGDLGVSEVAKKEEVPVPVIAPVIAPAPPPDTSKIVNVVRNGNKREQYSVTSEPRS